MKARLVSFLPCAERRPLGVVFCIHHAGGGGAAFAHWPSLLGPAIQVATVVLPGRERLAREPVATSFAALLDRLCEELQDLVGEQAYAILGHSLGAVFAFEAACRMQRLGPRPPTALIVSGRGPLHLPVEDEETHGRSGLSDEALTNWLRRTGGTPQEVLGNPELLAWVLPRLRADFLLAESYRYDGVSRSESPTLVLSGASDPLVEREHLARWGELSSAETVVRIVEGDHFFIVNNRGEAAAEVRSFLERRFPAAR